MDDHLKDMALFVEVVKAKGFRSAADALGVPNSTLSRRISELEKSIGLRLLHRTTRRIELTEAGQIYYERCRRIVDEARLAHEQLGAMLAQPSGVLRASLPVDFAVTYLAPLIAEFARLYPGISFDFDLAPRRVDLVSEPFDVAIRMGESESSQLIARKLAMVTPHLYASPGYLQRSGEPSKPAELAQHECFNIVRGGVDAARWQKSRHGIGRRSLLAQQRGHVAPPGNAGFRNRPLARRNRGRRTGQRHTAAHPAPVARHGAAGLCHDGDAPAAGQDAALH